MKSIGQTEKIHSIVNKIYYLSPLNETGTTARATN